MAPARSSVILRRLFPRASFVGCADIQVRSIACHSDQCRPGTMFAVMAGTGANGCDYIRDAIDHGARSVLVSRPLPGVHVPQCVVGNVRAAYSRLCHALAGDPSRHVNVTGVTGTNGKTTVTWLLRSIFETTGRPAGLLGTVEYHDGETTESAGLTTPDADVLARWLGSMRDRAVSHAALELSSHALDQDRAAGLHLAAAVITNITHDHFDYHGHFHAYRTAKLRIMELCADGVPLILNLDDKACRSVPPLVSSHIPVVTFGIESAADVSARILDQSLHGTRFLLHHGGDSEEVRWSLIGRHNVSNGLAAAAAALVQGFGLKDVAAGLENVRCVPGRLERVHAPQWPGSIFVDYAHTPDALTRVVSTLKQLTNRRVISVFGAGGDRDRSKRPLMAQAVQAADIVILTSDNPRTEPPLQIISEIHSGFDCGRKTTIHIEPDRSQAIQLAIDLAQPDDCVLIAGKGHETVQLVGDQALPFDDRSVARHAVVQHITQANIPNRLSA